MKLELLATSLTALISFAIAYSGDMTYYTPGMGSCGQMSNDGDGVVALSTQMMSGGANPNANAKCGSKIGIFNPNSGLYVEATVVDTCEACAEYDIDVDQATFSAVAPNGDGRVHGVDWGGDVTGG